MMEVTILIVDDHEVLREGIRSILKKTRPDWEVCGEATTGVEAIEAASRLKPKIILLDISMPGLSGLEAASRISSSDKSSKILMFTMHESGELANEARRAGAHGYVTKTDASRELVRAIETLLGGGTFFGHPQKNELPADSPGNVGLALLLRVGLAW
jgi:DNA-binding NarL/FixJ family response regulator